MIAVATGGVDKTALAMNIRKHMVEHDLKYTDVTEATGVDERTLRNIMKMRAQPHAQTVKKIADGLGMGLDELFAPVEKTPEAFDKATNTIVTGVVNDHPELFDDWSYGDFEEMYSTFAVGGQLTETGVLSVARRMNSVRELKHMVAVVMQSSDADLLATIVREMYRRVTAGQKVPA